MAKVKQKDVDKWVKEYLTKTENSMGLKLDRIPWECPKCNKKIMMVTPTNKYIASYMFKCNNCEVEQRHRHMHFYIN